MKGLLLFLLTAIALCSCKKNNSDSIKPSSASDTANLWKAQPDVTLDKKIVQSLYSTDSFLYVATTNYLLKIDENNKLVSSYKVSEVGNALYAQPFLNSKYYGYIHPDNKGVTIGLVDKPWVKKEIDLIKYDSSAYDIESHFHEIMAINNSDQVLLAVDELVNGASNGGLSMLILDLHASSDSIIVKFDKKVPYNANGQVGYYNDVFSVGSDFYFSTGNDSTYKIALNSNTYSPFMPYSYCFHVQSTDTSVFIGFNDFGYGLGIFAITSTWSRTLNFNFGLSYGDVVCGFNNTILVIYGDQIALATINYPNGTLQFNTLATNGVPDEELSLVAYFNGKVYLGSFEGLYYKSLKHIKVFK